MNYDRAFFEMIKLRGKELYPLSLPYAWYSIDSAAGIVLMDKENNYELLEWWMSWIRIVSSKDKIKIEATTQKRDIKQYYEKEIIATDKELEKMSGDDIVHLLATHFLFLEDLQHD